MKVGRFLTLVLLLSTLAFGQNSGSSPVVRGASADLVRLDTSTNTALVRVTNTSTKDITAFVLAAVTVYANGKTDRDERMIDLVLTMIPKQASGPTFRVRDNLIHPGESREETVALTPIHGNPITRLDVQVEVVAYVDQTAQVTNEEAFGRLLDERRGNLWARQRTVEIIHKALGDPAALHPIANAITDLQALHVRPRTQKEVSLDSELSSVIRDLQDISERSIGRDSTGAQGLREYAATKEKESSLLTLHVELRRQP